MKKRMLVLLLALVLAAGFLPLTVRASFHERLDNGFDFFTSSDAECKICNRNHSPNLRSITSEKDGSEFKFTITMDFGDYNHAEVDDYTFTYTTSGFSCDQDYADSVIIPAEENEFYKKNRKLDITRKRGHVITTWTPNTDGMTHSGTCLACGESVTDNCSGGTATCTTKAVCSTCGREYGDINPSNHSFTYSADGAVLTRSCSTCGKQLNATLPEITEAYTYTGNEIKPLNEFDVKYTDKDGDTFISAPMPEDELLVSYENNINAGTATAYITWDGETKATRTFTITKATPTAGHFTVSQTEFLYDGSEKDVTIVCSSLASGMGTIAPIKYYDADGNIVEGKPVNAGTYTIKIDVAECDNYTAISDLAVGTLTISYIPTPDPAYTIRGAILYNGTYYANATSTVTLIPPEGYSISAALDGTYGNSVDFTIDSILDKVYLKRASDGAMTDSIPVRIVFDITAPTGNIRIDEQHSWDKLISPVTFDLFLKGEPSLAITATDDVSGVASIKYFVSDAELDVTQIPESDWKLYTAPVSLEADGKYVLYAKLTDNVGNVSYLSSNGIVVDNQPPAFYGIEDGGVYYGYKIIKVLDNNNLLTFYMDDVDVTDQIGGDDEFKLIGDNKSHTLRVVDAAGNVTEWTVTVMKNYTVTFTADGEKVTEVTVGHGQSAAAPAVPEKEGYTGAWDKDGKDITADTTITAVYTIKKYTVTYVADNKTIETQTVEHGKDATAPTVPTKDGYSGAWDKDGKNITADTSITAVYTIKKYTVTYVADGKTVETLTVEHGKDATAPTIPAKDGYSVAWDHNGKNITEDTAIGAVYTAIDPGEFEDTTPATNHGGGKLAEDTAELEKVIPLTEEEKTARKNGADIQVWLEMKDISKSVPANDKTLVEKKLNGNTLGMYLDVTLYKKVGTADAVKLTELSDSVTITLTLPDSLINTNPNVIRTYYILHVHNGDVSLITPIFDAKAKTLTFEADSFSTYAIVYKDVTKPDPNNPGTGDNANPLLWSLLLLASTCGMAYATAKRRSFR